MESFIQGVKYGLGIGKVYVSSFDTKFEKCTYVSWME